MKTQMKMIAVLALLCAPLCAQEWSIDALPGNLSEHAMVRDIANDRLVVFGGIRNGVLSNETWSYDPVNKAWNQVLTAGIAPSPRREVLGAYDARRNRMIVFGGTAASGYTNDAFALDLTPGAESWTELAAGDPVKPLARTHGVLIVDERHDRAVLYGGYRSPTMLRDVWELDLDAGDDWVELSTVNHPAGNSIGDAGVYDPVGQRLLLYRAYVTQFVSLSLDADLAWTNHTNGTTSVHSRYAAAAYDSARNEMVIHGGLLAGSDPAEAYRVNLETMEFSQLPDEPKSIGRFWHTAAYDERRDCFIVVGGRSVPSAQLNTMASLALLPGAPEELAPNGDVVSGSEVNLSWKHSVGIGDGRYVVEVYREDGRIMVPQHNVTVSGNQAVFVPEVSDLADVVIADGEVATYVWQVMAINDNGSSEYSELASFRHVHEAQPPVDSGDDGDTDAGHLGSHQGIGSVGEGASQANLQPGSPAVGTAIVGGGSSEEPTINGAGCAGGSGTHGLALVILLLGIAGVAARKLKRA